MKKAFLFFKSLIFNQVFQICSILVFAAILRLYRISDYLTFLGDEGRDVLKVYEILHGKLTLLGPTSSVGGFFLGPIYYYFMAPFLWLFNYNPVGPAVMVALFGVATVFLIYKFCSNLFNHKVGIIAAFLYAISPLVIAYSRSSWNPNLLPFFSLLSLYTIYKVIEKKSLKYALATGFLLGIAIQLHYLAIFLGVVIFSYVFVFEFLTKSIFKEKALSLIKRSSFIIIGFLIGWSPFLAFEFRHGFLNFNKIFDFVFHSGNTGANPNFFLTLYDVFFRLFGRLVVSFPPPEQLFKFDNTILILWTVLTLLLAISSTIYLVLKTYSSFKANNEDFKKYLLLSIWFLVGIILFGFYKKPIYDYYFSFMFPLPFILVGFLIVYIYENKKLQILGKSLAVFLFLLFFVLNIQGLPFRYEPNRQLNQMKTIADFVMTRSDAKPFNFALITGGNSDHAYRYFFTVWNNPNIVIEDEVHDPERKTVTDQLFVVCESLPCKPLGHSLWEIAGFGQADIAESWDISVVKVYKLIHYKGK